MTGYSVSKDVAVLELRDAKGLATARTGNSNTVEVGDRVTAVGNGGGAGPDDEERQGDGARAVDNGLERRRAVHARRADRDDDAVAVGRLGGPLLSGGRVIGIDAAASGSFSYEGSAQGYAIPINRALKITGQIEAGRRSSTVHVGPTAFLGIAPARAGDGDEDVAGALVEDVVALPPTERASARATSSRRSPASECSRLRASGSSSFKPRRGNTVRVTWIDPPREEERGRATSAGPPQ